MSNQPNIIIVVADQLRYDSLGASGNQIVKTPQIDAFAEEGLVFDKAYSSCPPNVPTVMADYARRDISEYYGCVSALEMKW